MKNIKELNALKLELENDLQKNEEKQTELKTRLRYVNIAIKAFGVSKDNGKTYFENAKKRWAKNLNDVNINTENKTIGKAALEMIDILLV
jgi:ribosomal protein L9